MENHLQKSAIFINMISGSKVLIGICACTKCLLNLEPAKQIAHALFHGLFVYRLKKAISQNGRRDKYDKQIQPLLPGIIPVVAYSPLLFQAAFLFPPVLSVSGRYLYVIDNLCKNCLTVSGWSGSGGVVPRFYFCSSF